MPTTRIDQRLRLMRQGEHRLRSQLADTGPDLAGDSELPGWTRGHVVAHLIGNAEALLRLTTWARTGVETPMYAGPEARAEQIERDHAKPAAVLLGDLDRRSTELIEVTAGMTAEQWEHPVRTAQGREVAAAEIGWLRTRESFVHLVDLRIGTGFEDLPAEFVDALLDETTAMMAQRPGSPAVLLRPVDRDRTWSLAPGTDPEIVSGPAATLLAWLTGRRRPAGYPPVPPWL